MGRRAPEHDVACNALRACYSSWCTCLGVAVLEALFDDRGFMAVTRHCLHDMEGMWVLPKGNVSADGLGSVLSRFWGRRGV